MYMPHMSCMSFRYLNSMLFSNNLLIAERRDLRCNLLEQDSFGVSVVAEQVFGFSAATLLNEVNRAKLKRTMICEII